MVFVALRFFLLPTACSTRLVWAINRWVLQGRGGSCKKAHCKKGIVKCFVMVFLATHHSGLRPGQNTSDSVLGPQSREATSDARSNGNALVSLKKTFMWQGRNEREQYLSVSGH